MNFTLLRSDHGIASAQSIRSFSTNIRDGHLSTLFDRVLQNAHDFRALSLVRKQGIRLLREHRTSCADLSEFLHAFLNDLHESRDVLRGEDTPGPGKLAKNLAMALGSGCCHIQAALKVVENLVGHCQILVSAVWHLERAAQVVPGQHSGQLSWKHRREDCDTRWIAGV